MLQEKNSIALFLEIYHDFISCIMCHINTVKRNRFSPLFILIILRIHYKKQCPAGASIMTDSFRCRNIFFLNAFMTIKKQISFIIAVQVKNMYM